MASKFRVAHGLTLAGNGDSWIDNLYCERLDQDPVGIPQPGRIWFNNTERVMKMTNLDDQGQVVVRVIGYDSTGSGGAFQGGFVFITDVQPTDSGNVALKQYESNTVPANTVLNDCTSDVLNVDIHFLAEGSINYSPIIQINGTVCTNLSQYGDDRRLFQGSIPVSLTCAAGESEDFVVSSSSGQSATITIHRAGVGPAITTIAFGNYPGTQTHLKEDDTIFVTVTVENDAVACWIENGKACKTKTDLSLGGDDGAGVGYKFATGQISISSITSDAPIDAQASNIVGTNGDIFTSANLQIDQTYPVLQYISTTYPTSQNAIKDNETADVQIRVSNWIPGTDTIQYTNPLSQLSIPSPGTYEETKTVTRIGGDYNVSQTNYTVIATRTNNGASTSSTRIVNIANVAASITIIEPASRLRTRSTGFSDRSLTTASTIAEHMITINSNQQLNSIPTLASPDTNKGVWKNANFVNVGGMTSFRNYLQLADDCIKGEHTWGTISATGLSGIETTVITGNDTYFIGGLLPRYYRITLGQNSTSQAVEVTNYTKFSLTWEYTDEASVVKVLTRASTINTAAPVTGEYTIDAVSTDPTTFIILDTAATQAQTADTAILVEEGV